MPIFHAHYSLHLTSATDAWLPHIDVEPITGAVLSGQKFGQVNVLVGQRGRFEADCALFDADAHPYACMRETYMPVFWYQQSGGLTPEIAAVIAPNIKAAAIARTVMRASVYVGSILGGACLLAAAWVMWKAQGPQDDDYATLPTYDALDTGTDAGASSAQLRRGSDVALVPPRRPSMPASTFVSQ